MAKSTLRTKSIGTKLTDDEYEQLLAVAAGQTLSEWVRDLVLKELSAAAPTSPDAAPSAPAVTSADRVRDDTPGTGDDVLLGEVLGLRTIVLNVVYALGRGETLTAERMQGIIDRADAGRLAKASERREAARYER